MPSWSHTADYRPITDEPLAEQKGRYEPYAQSPTASRWSFVSFLEGLLAGIAVALLLVWLVGYKSFMMHDRDRDDLQSTQWPHMPLVDHNFTDYNDQERQDAPWFDIFTEGVGIFAAIENPRDFGLPKGAKWAGEDKIEWYSMAVFHQLHCLGNVKTTMEKLFSAKEDPEAFPDHDAELHARHCINYLRQSIQCSGDMTFESLIEAGNGEHAISGWTGTHVCKDWEAIRSFAKEHRLERLWDGNDTQKS